MTTPQKTPDNNGRYVAENCETERVVRLLDGVNGRLIATLNAYDDTIHRGDSLSVIQFSPDDQFLVTVCSYSTCRIWKCDDGRLASSPNAHGWINGVAFAADGRTLKIDGEADRGPGSYEFRAEYDIFTGELRSCSCDRCVRRRQAPSQV